MNLFVLHHLPLIAARWHHDADVRAQPREAAILLTSAWVSKDSAALAGRWDREVLKPLVYAACYIERGPWLDWVARSAATYDWAWRYAKELSTEHRFRFGVDHPCSAAIDALQAPPPAIAGDRSWRLWPTVMPSKYRDRVDARSIEADSADAGIAAAYREYYFARRLVSRPDRRHGTKPRRAKWTGRPTPPFVIEMGGGRG